jgi:hypothetical protein
MEIPQEEHNNEMNQLEQSLIQNIRSLKESKRENTTF